MQCLHCLFGSKESWCQERNNGTASESQEWQKCVCVRLVQDMYENSETEVKCAVEVTDVFEVEVKEPGEVWVCVFSLCFGEKRNESY